MQRNRKFTERSSGDEAKELTARGGDATLLLRKGLKLHLFEIKWIEGDE